MELRIDDLRKKMSGGAWGPGEAGYREATGGGFNLAVEHSPAVVVDIESVDDAREAIRFAAENNLRISIQATGHGTHSPVTSGMLISTRRLNGVSIDPSRRLATIGAGTRWGEVVSAAAEHGLLPITGSSPTVGVAGYLLGGGIGPLNRSHGFSSDYLEAATLVTGRGDVITANRDERPDLLWALRGGKHGLGLVTEVEVRLVEMSSLYGGFLMFAEEHIDAAFRAWVDWTATADPRVTTSVAVIAFPPVEAVPEPFRGKKMLSLRFGYPGSSDEGERLAAPLRAIAPVFMDTISEMPAAEVGRIHNDPVDRIPNTVGGRLLTSLDQDATSVILRAVGAGTRPPITVLEVRHLGGASSVDVPEGSAAGGRPANFTLAYVATNPMQFGVEVPQFAGNLFDELTPWISPEGNINFLGTPSSDEDYARSWSPETYARLTDIRKGCDPEGLFVQSH